HGADEWPRPFRTWIGRQHQHGDIGIFFDHVDDLFGRVTLADHPFGGDRGDAVGAARSAIERLIGLFQRLGAHDVGNPQPLLVLIFGLDDTEHHHPTAGPDRPAARIANGAIPFGRVVNNYQAFWLVTRLITAPPAGHACPEAATSGLYAATA